MYDQHMGVNNTDKNNPLVYFVVSQKLKILWNEYKNVITSIETGELECFGSMQMLKMIKSPCVPPLLYNPYYFPSSGW